MDFKWQVFHVMNPRNEICAFYLEQFVEKIQNPIRFILSLL